MKSVDRAIDVFELVSTSPHQLTFSQIAGKLAVPKSSLSQLLRNLVERGYLELDGSGSRYGLGPQLRALVASTEVALPPRRMIHTVLEELRDRFNETVGFYEHRGDEIEIVDRVESRHALQLTMAVGERAPLYAHSAGKIVLGFMSEPEISSYLARTRIEVFAAGTLRSKRAIRRSALEARRTGIAFVREELASGVCGYAVPVAVGNDLIGVINVALPLVRHDEKLAAEVSMYLPRVARRLTAAIERQKAVVT